VGRDILVDGYNVIKRDASFQTLGKKNLAAARQLLVNQLVNRYLHTSHRVIVVFDGNGASEQTVHDRHVRVIYSRAGETADSVIARLATTARAAGHEVEIFSDDAEVQQSGARQGGKTGSTDQLTRHLNAAPPALARLSHHRQKARRQYGLNPAQKYEYEEYEEYEKYEPPRSPRRKKKKASRHHS
jgi:uncharacterized protein